MKIKNVGELRDYLNKEDFPTNSPIRAWDSDHGEEMTFNGIIVGKIEGKNIKALVLDIDPSESPMPGLDEDSL